MIQAIEWSNLDSVIDISLLSDMNLNNLIRSFLIVYPAQLHLRGLQNRLPLDAVSRRSPLSSIVDMIKVIGGLY